MQSLSGITDVAHVIHRQPVHPGVLALVMGLLYFLREIALATGGIHVVPR